MKRLGSVSIWLAILILLFLLPDWLGFGLDGLLAILAVAALCNCAIYGRVTSWSICVMAIILVVISGLN